MSGSIPGNPFSNLQPSLAITQVMLSQGIFPTRGGVAGVAGDTLGFVYHFAGNFAPGTSMTLQGQLLPISQNQALFSLLGTTYGGNGITNFALPNLQGTATIGVGTGSGLATQNLGVAVGAATVSLTSAQTPVVAGGAGQSFSNIQPSLPLQPLIAVSGPFASQGGGGAAFIGQIAWFAGNFVPDGWAAADGSLLSIAQNTRLFTILGTTYGGNGITNFALPDLRGRVAVGASNTNPLGSVFGQDPTIVTTQQLPANDPALAGTGITGGGQPVSDDQPSLAVNYLIAIYGIFPSQGSGTDFNFSIPTLGQIVAFAGNFAPGGWAFANGDLLPINENQALFSILGTTYGGDGVTTFALPNLTGATPISIGTGGGGTYSLGALSGTDAITLSQSNLPSCFATGTRIATTDGEIAVENLRAGDIVRLANGDTAKVIWLGHRRLVCQNHPRPHDVWPVRVLRHAFGRHRPSRDLVLSPDHALFVEGALIPVRYLLNGATVRQEQVAEVTYYHVELARHDVLLAEGLPVESYLDTGNRSAFANGGPVVDLQPTFARGVWRRRACAKLATSGPLVAATKAKLLARLPELGFIVTRNSGLLVEIDGVVQEPQRHGAWWTLAIPHGARWLGLRSRWVRPGEVDPASRDMRVVGVPLTALYLDGVAVALTDARFIEGWHPADHGLRWTDGAGLIDVSGADVVELRFGDWQAYITRRAA